MCKIENTITLNGDKMNHILEALQYYKYERTEPLPDEVCSELKELYLKVARHFKDATEVKP